MIMHAYGVRDHECGTGSERGEIVTEQVVNLEYLISGLNLPRDGGSVADVKNLVMDGT